MSEVTVTRQVSTYPLPLGSYHIDSGTSMAAPETAGCIALFLQAKPGAFGSGLREVPTVRSMRPYSPAGLAGFD